MNSFVKPVTLLLIFVLVMTSKFDSCSNQMVVVAQARPLSGLSGIPQQRYARIFDTLGMTCKCCDLSGKDCSSRWTGSCLNLQCSPWRFH